MATSSAPRPPGFVDPLKGSKYLIQLGSSVSQIPEHKEFVAVTCNHKPKHTTPTQRTTLKPTEKDGHYRLVITDEGSSSPANLTYKYDGTLRPVEPGSAPSYALVFSQEKNVFLLEKISTDMNFNLVSAPGKQTRAQLATQYPQVELQPDEDPSLEEEELFQDGSSSKSDSEGSAADDDNPYDYRHFMPNGKYAAAASSATPNLSRAGTPSQSPSLKPQPPKSGYLSANSPAMKARPKVKAIVQSGSKPAHQASSSTSTISKSKPTSIASATRLRTKTPPRIVEDAYSPPSASSDSDSDSDVPTKSKSKSSKKAKYSSELIIDMGSPPPTKARKPLPRFKGVRKSNAPISFREAASASENEGDADESGLDVDADGDYEADDGDIELLKLPSPARVQSNPDNGETAVGLGLGQDMMDEEDDLAAALTMELEKDVQQEEEESEVSEEE